MKYDGQNPLHAGQARLRLEALIKKGAPFELTEIKPKRTLRQSSYLFVTIASWATQTGYTKDEAESIYKWVNKDLYYVQKTITGVDTVYIRHTYELDTDEMTKSIDRWRNWAAANDVCPVYIPSPEEHREVLLMEMEIERNREYL